MLQPIHTLQQGRGAQINTENPFLRTTHARQEVEVLDELPLIFSPTTFFEEEPKKILQKVNSPDVGMVWSLNPYQGCEHGCVYCYARNTHPYWGFSAGIDFESKIMVKKRAAALLREAFMNPSWKGETVSFSGNTDCYQPAEKRYKITRSLLEVCLAFKNPVSIITKSHLICRDIDLLTQLAALNLVQVFISITGTNEKTREKLEPRTSTFKKRWETVQTLANKGIPVQVMIAPVIPGLNDHEMPEVIRLAAKYGAVNTAYAVIRLNGDVEKIFSDWLLKAFPDRADKILNQISCLHGGQVSDSRFGVRMRGEGPWAASIHKLFRITRHKYFEHRETPVLQTQLFQRPGQLRLPL